MKNNLTYLFALCGLIFGLTSCSIAKYIPEDEFLYTGAKLEIETDSIIKNENKLKEELESVLSPEPNKKILGMRPGLYFHYKSQQKKPGLITRWLNKKIGQKPVYKSDVDTYQTESLLLNRLDNRGYFYSEAKSEFIDKKKTTSVIYKVAIPTPYRMQNFQLDSMPEPIQTEIRELSEKSIFKEGRRFDLTLMKLERKRIDYFLKSKGYYNFNEGFLIFEADTNRYDNKKFDLFLKLKKEVPQKSIMPYRISKVNIYPNYKIEDSIKATETRYESKNYIQEGEFFKPKYLDPFVKIQEGQNYSPEVSRNTARRLSTIGAYKYVNIQYQEIDSLATDSLGILEANIFLSPLNKRSLRAEVQVVTKSNNFSGPALAFTYSNRNVFGGGETFNISTKVGYEVQFGGGGKATGKSSLELGLKNELIFPRVLFPVKINDDFFEYSIPKTKISLGLDYLNRTKLYKLLSGSAMFGYLWDANRFVSHEINPLTMSYTKLSDTTIEFEEILENNPFLKRSFEQQYISGLTYGFTYNGMVDVDKTHQFYLNARLELAGNSLSLVDKPGVDGGSNTFLGMEYAQYAKADIDFHYHWNFGKDRMIAARLFGGFGKAYGNSDVVPFVKQYYSGGPYSVRAFRIRSLGPGTYNDEDNPNGNFFDKTGNIRLEANIEYRFPIISFLKGAVFADAGNIWNSKENPSFGGKDTFSSNFINELGMGAGVGLRVDIQSFVIRFDLAAPFHNPSLAKAKRFDFDLDGTILNFAIGYPF